MDDRKLEVLRAIVTDYVSSQEPVGSKALVEQHDLGVSPATVRNDMAALEEEGYIMQPHTSAGRIPTDKGYRLFVDRLGSLKPLSPAEQRAIQTFLSGALDLDDVLHTHGAAAGPGHPAGGHRAVSDAQPLRRTARRDRVDVAVTAAADPDHLDREDRAARTRDSRARRRDACRVAGASERRSCREYLSTGSSSVEQAGWNAAAIASR